MISNKYSLILWSNSGNNLIRLRVCIFPSDPDQIHSQKNSSIVYYAEPDFLFALGLVLMRNTPRVSPVVRFREAGSADSAWEGRL